MEHTPKYSDLPFGITAAMKYRFIEGDKVTKNFHGGHVDHFAVLIVVKVLAEAMNARLLNVISIVFEQLNQLITFGYVDSWLVLHPIGDIEDTILKLQMPRTLQQCYALVRKSIIIESINC